MGFLTRIGHSCDKCPIGPIWGPIGPFFLDSQVGFFSQILGHAIRSVCDDFKENRRGRPIGPKISIGPSWAQVGPMEKCY